MKKFFQLEIVSLEENIFSGKAEMVVVPGIMGEIGILAGHLPILTMIKEGPIKIITDKNQQEIFYISGGTLEAQPNNVTILADTVVRASSLDEKEALIAQKNARKFLHEQRNGIEMAEAIAEIARATAKLRAVTLLKQSKKREKSLKTR